jgi:hypothetical protein
VNQYDFDATRSIDKRYRDVASAANGSDVGYAVQSFIRNMDRVAAMSALPLALLNSMWVLRLAGKKSQGGSRRPGGLGQTDQERYDEVLMAILANGTITNTETIESGFEATISAMIIAEWTAFETLAGDLWEGCLNMRPRLGIVALQADVGPDDDEPTAEKKSRAKFQMPVGMLREFNYDLKHKMGTALRTKWDFAQRNQAAEAYFRVFGRDPLLVKIFDDSGLRWLAATRNVLVHNAGIADREFMQLIKNHSTLKLVKYRHPVPVTGYLALEFADAASKRGIELIEFATAWLAGHKD